MRERSRARGWALQTLYAWESKGGDQQKTRYAIRARQHLAERYGTPESPRFVNGVLDAAMRSLGADGSAGRA